jgi:hypothetical protein
MNLSFYKVSALSFLILFSTIYQSSAQTISGKVIETVEEELKMQR